MKKNLKTLCLCFTMALCLSSCYTYTHVVGDGPQTGLEVRGHNHYFIYGLAQGNQTDPKELAGGAENYRVTIQHTFVDGLLNAITFGIYTPTTTIVEK